MTLEENSDNLLQLDTQLPIYGASIRPLQRSEIPDIIAFDTMAMLELTDTPKDHLPPPLTQKELAEAYERGDIIGGIFTKQKELIAFYWFEPKKDELYVSSMAVHPQYRDRKLGKYFLNMADQEARARGLPRCTLSVDPFNGRGLNLYLKHGYRITDYKKNYFGEDYPQTDRFWMVKELNVGTREPHAAEGEQILIRCNDPASLVQAIADGYRGFELVRSSDGNSRLNQVKFQKAA